MRERSEQRDPQMQRQRLHPGHQQYFATCHPGLEQVVAAELAGPSIRAADIQPGKAGVSFTGDVATGYRANLWLRSAIRVLALLSEGALEGRRPAGEEIYDAFREAVDWSGVLAPGQTFSVESRVWSCSNLSSSQLLLVRARDAICDALRDARGAKPLPPEPGRVADVPLFVTAYHDRLSIYRDMSGASLHRRGYRQAMHRASLNEAAAAGILHLAGWHRLCRQEGAVLVDPMCGSGTFAIEAALMASNTAPGSFRRWWPFTQWRGSFDARAWADELEAAQAAVRAPPRGVEAWGNDVHSGALGLALRDVQAAGVAGAVRLHHGECRTWQLPRRPAVVVSNPPWGQRLRGRPGEADALGSGGALLSDAAGGDVESWWAEEAEEEAQERARGRAGGQRSAREERAATAAEEAALQATWHNLSTFLKLQCGGTHAFLLSGSPEASKGLRLKADRRLPLTVGGVDCRLLQYGIRARAADAGVAEDAPDRQ